MNSQQLRLLTATTAIMAAAASGAFADTLSSTSTTTVQTSSTVGGIVVSGSSTITGAIGRSAVEVSGSTASNTIQVNTGSTIKAGAGSTSATIQVMDGIASGAAINVINSGTITTGASSTVAFGYSTSSSGVVTIQNYGTISGSINLSSTADVISNTGTINGNVDLGSGNNIVYISGSGVLNGTLTAGGGTDTLNISNSTSGFTTQGAISGIENVNVSNSTVTLNHAPNSFLTNLRADASSTLNVNQTLALAASSNVNVSGTLNLAGGKAISATNVSFENGGKLGMTVNNSTTASKIAIISAGGGRFEGGSLTISIASNAGYIASGTQYQLVAGDSAAAVLPSLTTSRYGLYTLSATLAGTGGKDVSLTLYRDSINSVATNSANTALGSVLEGISTTTNTQLQSVQGLISSQSSLQGVNDVLDQLTPANTTGAAVASVNVSTQTGNQVSNRLASLRGGNEGMNTGDGTFTKHFWMQAFGNVSSQDDKDGFKGYDANTVGGSAGIDTDTLVNGMTTGLAFSYGKSNVDSNATGNTSTDIDSYQLTAYGSKVLNKGIFMNGQVGVGINKYDTTRQVVGLGTANGDFDGMQYSAKLEGGKDFSWNCMTLTPLASAQYTYLDMDKYTETGLGGANNVVDTKSFNALDLGLGGQVAWNMPMRDGGTLKPVVRAKYIYRAGDDSVESNSRFVGGGAAYNSQGISADRSSVDLGTGVTLSTMAGIDLSLDYDADLRSSYTGHTGQLKARWAF